MNTLTVAFDNRGDAPLTLFGRTRISLPGSSKTRVQLPDNQQTRALLARLRREYPLLSVITEKAEERTRTIPDQEGTTKAPTPESPSQDKADSAGTGKSKAARPEPTV